MALEWGVYYHDFKWIKAGFKRKGRRNNANLCGIFLEKVI